MATAEFSKFAGVLCAALSQHHLLGYEITNWNSITSTSFVHSDAFVLLSANPEKQAETAFEGARLGQEE